MRRKYDIEIDGYSIRNDADFDRVDMSNSERDGKHRKKKLEKRAETGREYRALGYLVGLEEVEKDE